MKFTPGKWKDTKFETPGRTLPALIPAAILTAYNATVECVMRGMNKLLLLYMLLLLRWGRVWESATGAANLRGSYFSILFYWTREGGSLHNIEHPLEYPSTDLTYLHSTEWYPPSAAQTIPWVLILTVHPIFLGTQ